MSKQITASRAVGTSIVVSLGDITLNLIVALLTNSSVMLSQALQGTADLTTAILLLVGVKKSSREADPSHPLGFGREVFFWTLLAGIFAFVVTGGFAVWQGAQQIIERAELDLPFIAFGMLLFGFVTNAYSMHISLKRLGLKQSVSDARSIISRMFHSSLVETKTTLLIDFMGTVSAGIGLVSIGLFLITGDVFFDGAGAVLVGLMTMSGAGLLIHNLRNFIVGVSPRPEVIKLIRETTLSIASVQDVLDLRALTIGSGKVLVILEVHFADELTTDDIEEVTDAIKAKLKKKLPMISRVQVEAETPDA